MFSEYPVLLSWAKNFSHIAGEAAHPALTSINTWEIIATWQELNLNLLINASQSSIFLNWL